MTKRIRVLIADDHPLIRDGLRMLLGTQADLEVVGEAADGIEALEMARQLRPDVLLIDIAMPGMSGLEVVPLVRDALPQTQMVILSMFAQEAYTHQALLEGARAYVLKGAPSAEVLAAVRAVHAGRYYFCAQIHADIIGAHTGGARQCASSSSGYASLSARERQVFLLLIEGHPSQRIGELLSISIKTVEKHRASISKKLGSNHPVDMVKFAIRYGIIDPDFWKA
jgi:two-component system, NarL family, response regulator NreC